MDIDNAHQYLDRYMKEILARNEYKDLQVSELYTNGMFKTKCKTLISLTILRFLLKILKPSKIQKLIWPLYDTKMEGEFRRQSLEIIKDIFKNNTKINMSLIITPFGIKYTLLLLDLCKEIAKLQLFKYEDFLKKFRLKEEKVRSMEINLNEKIIKLTQCETELNNIEENQISLPIECFDVDQYIKKLILNANLQSEDLMKKYIQLFSILSRMILLVSNDADEDIKNKEIHLQTLNQNYKEMTEQLKKDLNWKGSIQFFNPSQLAICQPEFLHKLDSKIQEKEDMESSNSTGPIWNQFKKNINDLMNQMRTFEEKSKSINEDNLNCITMDELFSDTPQSYSPNINIQNMNQMIWSPCTADKMNKFANNVQKTSQGQVESQIYNEQSMSQRDVLSPTHSNNSPPLASSSHFMSSTLSTTPINKKTNESLFRNLLLNKISKQSTTSVDEIINNKENYFNIQSNSFELTTTKTINNKNQCYNIQYDRRNSFDSQENEIDTPSNLSQTTYENSDFDSPLITIDNFNQSYYEEKTQQLIIENLSKTTQSLNINSPKTTKLSCVNSSETSNLSNVNSSQATQLFCVKSPQATQLFNINSPQKNQQFCVNTPVTHLSNIDSPETSNVNSSQTNQLIGLNTPETQLLDINSSDITQLQFRVNSSQYNNNKNQHLSNRHTNLDNLLNLNESGNDKVNQMEIKLQTPKPKPRKSIQLLFDRYKKMMQIDMK